MGVGAPVSSEAKDTQEREKIKYLAVRVHLGEILEPARHC